jgi:hypothetical protein
VKEYLHQKHPYLLIIIDLRRVNDFGIAYHLGNLYQFHQHIKPLGIGSL